MTVNSVLVSTTKCMIGFSILSKELLVGMAVITVMLALSLLETLLRSCSALSGGASPSNCATLTPLAPHEPGMNLSSIPYSLDIPGLENVNETYYYTPGRTYTGECACVNRINVYSLCYYSKKYMYIILVWLQQLCVEMIVSCFADSWCSYKQRLITVYWAS